MAALVTAACAIGLAWRLWFLWRSTLQGEVVTGRVLDRGNTGRFHVAWEMNGAPFEGWLGYGSLTRREAQRVDEVDLLVDPARPARAILAHTRSRSLPNT